MHFEQDYMERVTKTIGNMLVAIAAGKDAVQSGIEKFFGMIWLNKFLV